MEKRESRSGVSIEVEKELSRANRRVRELEDEVTLYPSSRDLLSHVTWGWIGDEVAVNVV